MENPLERLKRKALPKDSIYMSTVTKAESLTCQLLQLSVFLDVTAGASRPVHVCMSDKHIGEMILRKWNEFYILRACGECVLCNDFLFVKMFSTQFIQEGLVWRQREKRYSDGCCFLHLNYFISQVSVLPYGYHILLWPFWQTVSG